MSRFGQKCAMFKVSAAAILSAALVFSVANASSIEFVSAPLKSSVTEVGISAKAGLFDLRRQTKSYTSVSALAVGDLSSLSSVSQVSKNLKKSGKFIVPENLLPKKVAYTSPYPAGSILIDQENRWLYFIEDDETAIRYAIAVGKTGMAYKQATATISRKKKWPSWTPTSSMIKRNKRYAKYKNGMPGGPSNPLGSRAIYMSYGGKDTMYRIHGTTKPWTIGKAASNGCFRMINSHVEDLYKRVNVGSTIYVF